MFRDHFKDFQHLARELTLLRGHNFNFKPGNDQNRLLLFAEGAVVLLTLERFLRILPGVEATDTDTLQNLLEKATSDSRKLLKLTAENRTKAITQIVNVRNTVLHGNFEQAASQAGVSSVEEYFKTQFASEIESLFKITNDLVDQIDHTTGRPKKDSTELGNCSK